MFELANQGIWYVLQSRLLLYKTQMNYPQSLQCDVFAFKLFIMLVLIYSMQFIMYFYIICMYVYNYVNLQ